MAHRRKYGFSWPKGVWHLLVILVLATAVAQAEDSAQCTPKPVALQVRNVTLPSKEISRGVSLKVGQPQQELSFTPSWYNNSTFVYGPTCGRDGSPLKKCATQEGGLYDPAKSTTKGDVDHDFQAQTEPFNSDTYNYTSENVTIEDDLFIENFPLARPINTSTWDLQGYRTQHLLGLQSGSSILNTLYNSKSIASRSWGYFWGLDGRGSGDQSEGALVLGGYDRAKTYGDGFTVDMAESSQCPSRMTVVIQDVILNLSNGSDISLFSSNSGGQSLMACVMPSEPVLFELPTNPYFNRWQNVIGHSLELGRSGGIDFWNLLLSSDSEFGYDGGLTISFGDKLRVSIPNNHLVVPERKIDDQGKLYANYSQQLMRVNPLQEISANAFPKLGRYFFSQAYIMGNEDAQQFTIWKSNPVSTQDLVAVDTKNNVVDSSSLCTNRSQPTNVNTTTTAPNPSTTDTTKPDSGSTLSTGAIVGIAIGGALFGALVIGAAWFLWRRRRSEAVAALATPSVSTHVPSPGTFATKEHYSIVGYTDTTDVSSWPAQGQPHFILQELEHPGEMNSSRMSSRPIELP